jgi:hypothetical protein
MQYSGPRRRQTAGPGEPQGWGAKSRDALTPEFVGKGSTFSPIFELLIRQWFAEPQ